MTQKHQSVLDDLGRFTEQALLVLVSLSDGAKHGYAIIDDIEAITGDRLGAGTLYGAIARLEAKNLIVALAPVGRRKPYQLTAWGHTVLHERLEDLSVIIATGRGRLQLSGGLSP